MTNILEGAITSVDYHDELTQFTIAHVQTSPDTPPIRVIGTLPRTSLYSDAYLQGIWESNATAEKQFLIEDHTLKIPNDSRQLVRYISHATGVKIGYVNRLFETFGHELLKTIDHTPNALYIDGLASQEVDAIITFFNQHDDYELLKGNALAAGIPPRQIKEVMRHTGISADAIGDELEKDPFLLYLWVDAITWKNVYNFAQKQAQPPTHPLTIRAAIIALLRRELKVNGNTRIDIDSIYTPLQQLLKTNIPIADIDAAIPLIPHALVTQHANFLMLKEEYEAEKQCLQMISAQQQRLANNIVDSSPTDTSIIRKICSTNESQAQYLSDLMKTPTAVAVSQSLDIMRDTLLSCYQIVQAHDNHCLIVIPYFGASQTWYEKTLSSAAVDMISVENYTNIRPDGQPSSTHQDPDRTTIDSLFIANPSLITAQQLVHIFQVTSESTQLIFFEGSTEMRHPHHGHITPVLKRAFPVIKQPKKDDTPVTIKYHNATWDAIVESIPKVIQTVANRYDSLPMAEIIVCTHLKEPSHNRYRDEQLLHNSIGNILDSNKKSSWVGADITHGTPVITYDALHRLRWPSMTRAIVGERTQDSLQLHQGKLMHAVHEKDDCTLQPVLVYPTQRLTPKMTRTTIWCIHPEDQKQLTTESIEQVFNSATDVVIVMGINALPTERVHTEERNTLFNANFRPSV